MSNKFIYGSSLLIGDNTIPGVKLSNDLRSHAQTILKACSDWGLDFYPTVVQLLTYDEISEVAAYGGFPVRYPHWSFGMQYEELQRGYEYGAHKIFEMVINCCNLETNILTNRGTIHASEVKAGDVVFGKRGPRKVAKVVFQKKSVVKKIRLEKQFREIVCTPNHKWKVMKCDGSQWVETKDIKKGDILIGYDRYDDFLNKPYNISYDKNRSFEATRPNIRHCLKDVNIPSSMSLELAELMGILIGDGTIGVKGSQNNLSVAVGKDYFYYAEHVLKLFKSVFNTDAKIYEKPNCYNVVFCSKIAVDFLDQIGLIKCSTYLNKKIPFSIWQSSQEYRCAFIKGLFDTDGCCTGSISYSSKSKKLISDIQLMLAEMGIYTAAKHVNDSYNNIYKLNVSGRQHIRKFAKRISLVSKQKTYGLHKLINTISCSSGGIAIPFIQKNILSSVGKIKSTQNLKIYRSCKKIKDASVGSNTLVSLCEKIKNNGYHVDDEIASELNIPYFVVEEVIDNGESETVDIALYHDDHDFVADGIMSHNTSPCYIYCLDSNTLLDHLTVIAHATGHNDFFKNNIHFSATDTNMLNNMANHSSRIRKYIARWGKEKVTEFMDYILRLDTLVDGASAWRDKFIKDRNIADKRHYHNPKRLKVNSDRLYMDSYINTNEFKEKENEKVKDLELADELGLFIEPVKDVFGFLRDNAPLKPWQQDIMSMIYEESMYFYPQRQTKVLNEGWASMTDHIIMAEQGYVGLGQKSHDSGIIDYAAHKMSVLGGKYSTNPYKLGFNLFSDIRNRWDKGRFGSEWDECKDFSKKSSWDTKAMLGKDKIFEARKYHDDLTFIHEFFTEEFCREQEYFEHNKTYNGDTILASHDYKKIKNMLMAKHVNGGLPDIRLTEPNYRGKGYLMLEHKFEGRSLYEPYVRDVLTALRFIWQNDVYLFTKGHEGGDVVFECFDSDPDNVRVKSKK